MSLELFGFVTLSVGLLTTSALVVLLRNPLYGALSMIAGFFFLAGLYLQLNAAFVAVVQVLVYAGAIMVLFLFVIMLLNLREGELGARRGNVHKVLAAVAGAFVFALLVWAMVGAQVTYLASPAVMRSHSLQRLRHQGEAYSFATPAQGAAFFAAVDRLEVLASAQLVLAHGRDGYLRVDACRQVAALAHDRIDGARCSLFEVQGEALSIAAAETVAFDAQLAELESMVSGSALPHQWRGEGAQRHVASAPTREEVGALWLLELGFAGQLEMLIEREGMGLLAEGDQEVLRGWHLLVDARVPSGVERERQHPIPARGERWSHAMARADFVAGKVVGDGRQFVERRARLEAAYDVAQREVLVLMRRGERQQVAALLQGVVGPVLGQMGYAERALVQRSLQGLHTPLRRSAVLLRDPVIHDAADFGRAEGVGRLLFTRFLLPFEVTGVLLLVGMVGAVVLARRGKRKF